MNIMNFSRKQGSGLRLVLAGLLFGGIADLSAQVSVSPFTFTPKTVAANQAFTLTLKNPRFNCATNFSNLSVSQSGNMFYLGFTAVENPAVRCVNADSLFGPSFEMPPLPAGSDSIFAIQQPACAPLCLVPVMREFAGVLTVIGPRKDSTWFIQPKQTVANSPFTLQLLSNAYGNCQTVFTHTSLSISGGSLYASFVVEQHPERLCIADIRPHGPSYATPALPAGKYPVFAVRHLACEFTNPACMVAAVPMLVETLTVLAQNPPRDSGWFIQPKQAAANRAFTLQLLSYKYHDCQNDFTHASLNITGGALYVSFVVENHPERICAAVYQPHGPSYTAPALPIGKYPVYAVQHLACEYSNPACLIAVQPKIVDTLLIVATVSVLPLRTEALHFRQLNGFGEVKGFRIDGRKGRPVLSFGE